jgi:predicted HAD superfamily Cof-like phosphohydrolase
MALIREEYSELIDAMMDYYLNPSHEALAAVAKESADLHYVLYGTEDTLGIPSKAVFKQVHRSNMSKLINGVFKKRADGKILKGENYRAPNILAVIFGNDR